MPDRVRFRALRWEDLDRDTLYDLLALRQDVFVVEQRCAYQDLDGADRGASHVLGTDPDGLCCALRVLPPGEDGAARLGRVVTARRVRGQGLGRPLVRAGEQAIRDRFGPVSVRLSAQAHLERFYASLGWVADGEVHDEDGIPHLPMVKAAGPT